MSDSDAELQKNLGTMGFMSVEGMAMNTDMVPYREGGWNTNPHKLPGQTDFPPLTPRRVASSKPRTTCGPWPRGCSPSSGVPALSVYGRGVPLQHGGPSPRPPGDSKAYLRYQRAALQARSSPSLSTTAGPASVGFNNLDSMGNSILIHQMTVHHEGFDVLWGNGPARESDQTTPPSNQLHTRRTTS